MSCSSSREYEKAWKEDKHVDSTREGGRTRRREKRGDAGVYINVKQPPITTQPPLLRIWFLLGLSLVSPFYLLFLPA